MYFCTILSLFGLLQFVFGQFLNFNFYIKQALYEKSEFGLSLYRVTSIFSEPSHFGTYLCPAVIILIYGHNFIKFHHQKYLLLINTAALILSQSLNSFLLFLIYLFVFEIKKTKSQKQYSNIYQRMIIFTVITSAFIYLGLVDKSFQFSSDVSFRNENISGTSGLYFTTIQVLQDQLLLHPFFGFGLGNFNYAFNLTFQYLNPFQIETSDFSGTSSGWGKILVETGIIGFSFFIYFLFFGIKRNKSNDIFRFMNQISLIYIIFVLIRYGGFTPNIFFFMIASYTTSHYSAYESKYEALNSK